MGGLTSLASTAMQALSVVNTVAGAVNSYQDKSGNRDYEQLKQKAALDLQNAQNRAAYEKEEIRLSGEKMATEKRTALKRLIAKKRAELGANGVGLSDGSSEAVLLGLINEGDEEVRQREALDALKTSLADEGLAQVRRTNTLALTQAREKDKYNKYTSGYGLFDELGGLLK